ncbi:MAG: P-II family nitrogen regulator [Planctomycetota bacterium]
MLKQVWIVVKPFKAPDVVEALAGFASVRDLVVSECRGHGRQKGHLELYEGSEYRVTFLPKVRIELVCSAFEVEALVSAVSAAARTGRIGDGKVLILPVASRLELIG